MDNIREANAREVHIIEYMAGLHCQLANGQKILEDRLRSIPNGWRDFRLAMTTTERMLDKVYETLPAKTLKHMQRLCDLGEVVIRPKPAIKLPGDVQIVPTDDLKLLINKAMGAECGMCIKDARQQKKCSLRKAMMQIAPPDNLRKDGLCTYADVAVSNNLEEYID